jgi:hypothetical protein
LKSRSAAAKLRKFGMLRNVENIVASSTFRRLLSRELQCVQPAMATFRRRIQ